MIENNVGPFLDKFVYFTIGLTLSIWIFKPAIDLMFNSQNRTPKLSFTNIRYYETRFHLFYSHQISKKWIDAAKLSLSRQILEPPDFDLTIIIPAYNEVCTSFMDK
jgi:flagellar biosynthesis protein FliP